MELILNAWNEPQPFGWQGQYFQYRTISLWPRPQDPICRPIPRDQRRSGEFAARHHVGLGLVRNFESMAKAAAYYRKQCEGYGWPPGPDNIIYRAT